MDRLNFVLCSMLNLITILMKSFYCTTILSFLSFCLHAQQPKFWISASAGPSISLRNLATQITGSSRAQLAGNGWTGTVGVGYQFNKWLGVTARANYNQNQTRTEPIEQIAIDYKFVNPTITANDWSVLGFVGGPSLHWQPGRLMFDGSAVAGYAFVKSPSFIVKGTFEGRDSSVDTKNGESQGFAFGLSGRAGLSLSKTVTLFVQGDYLQSSMTFDVKSMVQIGSRSSEIARVEDQTVGVFNVSSGLKFSF